MARTIARDALHVVLSFLSLGDTARAGRVCCFWRSATESEPPKSCVLARDDFVDLLPTIVTSPLRRHVVTISRLFEFAIRVDSSQLALLHQFPRLTRLTAWSGESVAGGVLQLPRTLEHAELVVDFGTDSPPAVLDVAVRSLASATPHLHTLVLQLISEHATDVDLSPLSELSSLTDLSLRLELAPRQVELIRSSFGGLQVLDVNSGEWDEDQLRTLCAPGHQLHQLALLDLRTTYLDLEALQVVSFLPALTAVHRSDFHCYPPAASLAHLHLIPKLAFLDAQFSNESFSLQADASSLVPHASLRELRLRYIDAPQAHLTSLLRSLPHLHTLHLDRVCTSSLTPLIGLGELHTLSVSLVSRGCAHHAWQACSVAGGCEMLDNLEDHLTVFDQLPALTSLALLQLGRTRVLKSLHDQLRVPSVRFPRLRALYSALTEEQPASQASHVVTQV